MKLGVNIDHVATLRQARKGMEPNVMEAAKTALSGGADSITVHLREDRRHIQDHDVRDLRKLACRLNLEMAVTDEMIKIAQDIGPYSCCLVPEKREELTTEGGLDVANNLDKISTAVQALKTSRIMVSLFIEPIQQQIRVAKESGADYIEIHTGLYANSMGSAQLEALKKIKESAQYALSLGLKVNAGHGLNYLNVKPITLIKEIEELNIGHSIISQAMFIGMKPAVSQMKALLKNDLFYN
ncbi:pyridoxine 5'-phosphate synthase [Thermoproteota archaeon]